MSIELNIYIPMGPLPSRDEWQANIEKLGFNTVLTAPFRPQMDSGFIPCKYQGTECGFEFYVGSPEELFKNVPELREKANNANVVATFVWSSSTNDMCAGISAGTALAEMTGGFYHYLDDNIFLTASESVQQTRLDLEEAQRFLSGEIQIPDKYELFESFVEYLEKEGHPELIPRMTPRKRFWYNAKQIVFRATKHWRRPR